MLGASVDIRSCVSSCDIWKISLVVFLQPLVTGSRLFDCSCVRSTGTSFFLESTSGNAVLRASWSDSGYTFTFSTCTLHPAVTCWVLVALRVQFLDFLGDDGCCGLLVAGLWVPTTTLHRARPGHFALSRQFDGICGMARGFFLLTLCVLQWKVW